MYDGLPRLKEFTASMRLLERRLFLHVLGSFAVSLIAVLVQYERFGYGFQACTELIGGITGAAGLLTRYLSSFRPPEEDTDADILRSRPVLLGPRVGGLLLAAAGCYYGYYLFAQAADERCVLLLAAGNFLFFYGLAAAVFAMHQAEKRTIIWQSLSGAGQQKWLAAERARRQAIRRVLEQSEKLQREMAALLGKMRRDIIAAEESEREQQRREARRKRAEWWETYFWQPTLRLRRRLGWVRESETEAAQTLIDLEMAQVRRELDQNWKSGTVRDIQSGKHHPRRLDGLPDQVYEVGVWWFVVHPGPLDEPDLAAVLGQLRAGRPDLANVILVHEKDAAVSLKAAAAARTAGVDLFSERNHPPATN